MQNLQLLAQYMQKASNVPFSYQKSKAYRVLTALSLPIH
jgi:hypothetical protein